MSESPNIVFGSMRLFTSRGVEVAIPITEALATADFGKLLLAAEAVSGRALAAGWLAAPPGGALEKGEQREEIAWVLRTTNTGRNGLTQIVHLYSSNPGFVKPFIVVYLNTDSDIRDFEAASGLRVLDLPEYIGEGRIERGKSPKTDVLVVKAPRTFGVVYVPNPRYDEAEAEAARAAKKVYTVPKKKFLRWEGKVSPAPATPQASLPPLADGQRREPKTPAELCTEYRFAHTDDDFARLEAIRARLWPTASRDEHATMKGASDACRQRLADSVPEEVGGRF